MTSYIDIISGIRGKSSNQCWQVVWSCMSVLSENWSLCVVSAEPHVRTIRAKGESKDLHAPSLVGLKGYGTGDDHKCYKGAKRKGTKWCVNNGEMKRERCLEMIRIEQRVYHKEGCWHVRWGWELCSKTTESIEWGITEQKGCLNWLCLGTTTGCVYSTEASLMKRMKEGKSVDSVKFRMTMGSRCVKSVETKKDMVKINWICNEMRS